jgi:hypothetical protein
VQTSAAAVEADCHLVPDSHRADRGPDRRDRSAALVTEYSWQREREVALLDRHIGVADTDTSDLDEDFIRGRLGEVNMLNAESAADLADHRRFDPHIHSS